MTRTDEDLRQLYANRIIDPASELRLADWITTTTLPTRPTHQRGRRSWALAAGSAALVAVAVTISVVVPELHSTTHPTPPVTAVQPLQASPPPTNAAPTQTPQSVALTPQAAIGTLLRLLPASSTPPKLSGRSDPRSDPLGEVIFDDGHGLTLFDLAIGLPGTPVGRMCTPGQVTPATCTTTADGGTLGTNHQAPFPNKPNGVQIWNVELKRPDGLLLQLTEYNATSSDGPVTRTTPMLTLAQLTAIVSSPTWSPTITPATAASYANLFTPDPLQTSTS